MNARVTRGLAAAAVTTTALAVLAACGDTDPAPAAGATVTVDGVRIKKDPALHAMLPDAIKKAGKVRVATDVPYPPFEMFVKEGESALTGLDYDLGQALGGRLGVTFAYTPQKFDGIVPAIQAGKFDAAMSAITDNKERQQVVDFVDYSQSGSGILVGDGNPDKIADLDDLCGKKVAVQAATNQLDLLKTHQAACAKAGKGSVRIQTFPKDSDAQLALRSGKVAAQVLTKPAAGWVAKTADAGKAFDLVEDPAAPGGYNASPNGIAVSKRLPELTDAIQKALQSLIDDGTVTKIYTKYGVASIAVQKATRNAAVD
ncbi:ABC transporter substrate-binding protein [Streptomyces sp. NPDC048566]|uniref:ABC transporter substrate-binding protein n=1 Tax=Streptomyces sp. NPDC048566 TaxID=3365569 RepID=UPI003718B039